MKSGFNLRGLFLLTCLIILVDYASHFQTDTHNSARPTIKETSDTTAEPEMSAAKPAEETKSPAKEVRTASPISRSSEATNVVAQENGVPLGEGHIASEQVSRPVALTDPGSPDLLSEEQASAIEFIRAQFVTLLGGPNQDPADPTYFDRWTNAQKQVDEEFRSFLGEDAYNRQLLLTVAFSE